MIEFSFFRIWQCRCRNCCFCFEISSMWIEGTWGYIAFLTFIFFLLLFHFPFIKFFLFSLTPTLFFSTKVQWLLLIGSLQGSRWLLLRGIAVLNCGMWRLLNKFISWLVTVWLKCFCIWFDLTVSLQRSHW